jgi:orotidine-5'-phosphate decarboxylase
MRGDKEELTFGERLARVVAEKESMLVVGIDPRLERLPGPVLDASRRLYGESWEGAGNALLRFGQSVVEAVAPYAVAVKLQIAFYEMYGWWGLEAYAQIAAYARELGLMVIGDIKRGDIASTAEAYARAHLSEVPLPSGRLVPALLNADAVTINPYFGSDGIIPFLAEARSYGRGVFILVRTSNPSARELQDLRIEGTSELVWERVARQVREWSAVASVDAGSGDGTAEATVAPGAKDGAGGAASEERKGEAWSSVGAVVGATYPEDLERARELLPNHWILVPGYGAQGATARDAVRACRPGSSLGALVNASRSVIYAYEDHRFMQERKPSQWAGACADAARAARDELWAAGVSTRE